MPPAVRSTSDLCVSAPTTHPHGEPLAGRASHPSPSKAENLEEPIEDFLRARRLHTTNAALHPRSDISRLAIVRLLASVRWHPQQSRSILAGIACPPIGHRSVTLTRRGRATGSRPKGIGDKSGIRIARTGMARARRSRRSGQWRDVNPQIGAELAD